MKEDIRIWVKLFGRRYEIDIKDVAAFYAHNAINSLCVIELRNGQRYEYNAAIGSLEKVNGSLDNAYCKVPF